MKDYRVRVWGIWKAEDLGHLLANLRGSVGVLATAKNVEADRVEIGGNRYSIDICPVEIEHQGEKGCIDDGITDATDFLRENPGHQVKSGAKIPPGTEPNLITTYTDALKKHSQAIYERLEHLENERHRLQDRVKELEDKCGRLAMENRNFRLMCERPEREVRHG